MSPSRSSRDRSPPASAGGTSAAGTSAVWAGAMKSSVTERILLTRAGRGDQRRRLRRLRLPLGRRLPPVLGTLGVTPGAGPAAVAGGRLGLAPGAGPAGALAPLAASRAAALA